MILHKITKANSTAARFILAGEGEEIAGLLKPRERVESSWPVEEFLGGRLELSDGVKYPVGEEVGAVPLREAVSKFEARFIRRALALAGGRLVRASVLLGFRNYGSLQSLLDHRHRDLQGERKPITRRLRKSGGKKKGDDV